MNYDENDFPTMHSRQFPAKYLSRKLTLFIERALKAANSAGYAHFNYETTTTVNVDWRGPLSSAESIKATWVLHCLTVLQPYCLLGHLKQICWPFSKQTFHAVNKAY